MDYLDAMVEAAKSAKFLSFVKKGDGYHIYDGGVFKEFIAWDKEWHDIGTLERLEKRNKRRSMEAAYNAACEYMAKYGGLAALAETAAIHHKDGDPTNNAPSNLEIAHPEPCALFSEKEETQAERIARVTREMCGG